MKDIIFKFATENDTQTIKDIVNKMYGIEYETRDTKKIAEAIKNKTEIYVLAHKDDNCIGFCGSSINNDYYKDIISPDVAVIDYIYVDKKHRNFFLSFELISTLFKELVKNGTKQAIMQVQTYNPQRFLHYALSNKNIIKSTPVEVKGRIYEDQILLIEDLEKALNTKPRELIIKAYNFKNK